MGLVDKLRVIWAITAKDILDALRNKATLSNIVMIFLVTAAYRLAPGWFYSDDRPKLLLYDAGASSLPAALEDNAALDLYVYPDQAYMERQLGNGDVVLVPELGLVIPPDYDRLLASGQGPELEGYVAHWLNDTAVAELRDEVEDEITARIGRPVGIAIQERRVYRQPDRGGPLSLITSILLALTVFWMGISVVPHLMIEEKESKTIQALQISPASDFQLVIAKALAGLFYCLTVAAVVLAFNWPLITHWALAVVATVLGSLCAVAFGLLLGRLLEVKAQLSLWGMVLLLALNMPLFLSILAGLVPDPAIRVLSWTPAAAIGKAMRAALAGPVSWEHYGPPLIIVAVYTVLLLAAEVWFLRRSDR